MTKKKIDNEIFKTLIEDYNINDTNDIKDMIKEWFWIGENESSKYWLNVLNELKNRGVQDILIMSVDNLKGFSEAISSVFPKTEIQKCVVHQIRNSIRYISYKDTREFTSDLKEMYNAPTLEQAEFKLDELEEKWGKKYKFLEK